MSLEFADISESNFFSTFLFDNLSYINLVISSDFKIKAVNQAFIDTFHADEESVVALKTGNAIGCDNVAGGELLCGDTENCDSCSLRKLINSAFQHPDQVFSGTLNREFIIQGESQKKIFHMLVKHLLYKGEDVAVVCMDDVTEYEEQKRKAELANRDFLTALYNRRYLIDYGRYAFENAKRGTLQIAVVMMDIDFFKNVNDTYGHLAGDFVLTEFARIVQNSLRQVDIVTRYGGEEFCMLLTVRKPEDATLVINRLRVKTEKHAFVFEGKKISITISAGICTTLGENLSDMIKVSDDMLYEAKKAGRNAVITDEQK